MSFTSAGLPARTEQSHLEGFFQFVLTRHVAWYNRVILGRPAPWTSDPIIQRGRFTNVYRFLDRGTQFLIETILEPGCRKLMPGKTRYLLPSAFEELLAYRYVNNIDSWRKIRDLYVAESWDLMLLTLRQHREEGGTVMTPAYIATYCPSRAPGDGLKSLVLQLKYLKEQAGPMYQELLKIRDGRAAFEKLKELEGVGGFMAYQLLGDLRTPLRGLRGPVLTCNTWDWCHLGAGGLAGLQLIFPDATPKTGVQLAKFLHDSQVMMFRHLQEIGLTEMPYVTDLSTDNPEPVFLSLHDIEHSLCEYQKYVRGVEGGAVKGTLATKRPGDDWRPKYLTIPAYSHRSFNPA